MTMRTKTHFTCTRCGHRGYELLSENDQPYSANWERTDFVELGERKARSDGLPGVCYVCPKCSGDML